VITAKLNIYCVIYLGAFDYNDFSFSINQKKISFSLLFVRLTHSSITSE
jgi:hypothetical protein